MFYKNIEGYTKYNIDYDLWENRKPGLSAMLRLGNEEDFIRPCIESIIDWFDEIICILQCNTDNTENILRSFNSSKIKIYHYPFRSIANGPGHDQQPRGSIYERAYFYNWCLSKTSCEWVSKWDGDMVAHEWLSDEINSLIKSGYYDVICMAGTNIVHGLKHVSKHRPATGNEPRFFKVYPGVHYFTNKMCEDLSHPHFRRGVGFGGTHDQSDGERCKKLDKHGYLHFKHAKNDIAISMAWPKNWQDIPHFQRIYSYAEPGKEYKGEIPRSLQGIM